MSYCHNCNTPTPYYYRNRTTICTPCNQPMFQYFQCECNWINTYACEHCYITLHLYLPLDNYKIIDNMYQKISICNICSIEFISDTITRIKECNSCTKISFNIKYSNIITKQRLETYNVIKLKDIAKSKGLTNYKTLKKQELVNMLTNVITTEHINKSPNI